jgi:hypothetical protein
MTEAAMSEKKKVQVTVEEGGIGAVTINGTKVAEISPEGNVITFTDKGAQLAKPAAAADASAKKEGTSIDIGKDFNTVAMYGATVEVAADGKLIVSTNGTVTVKPAAANDTAIAAAKAALEVGDRMEDGTIFAGISPNTGKQMFALAADASLTMTFNKAKEYAAEAADAKGNKSFRVPTKEELNVLFQNREKGALKGTFNLTGSSPAGYYWSSTPYDGNSAWDQRFSSGDQNNFYRIYDSSVRCVR